MPGMGKGRRSSWEGSISLRKDKRYAVSLPYKAADGSTQRMYTTKKLRRDAVSWLSERRAERDGGMLVTGENPRLAEYLHDWLAYSVRGYVSESTVKNYTYVVRNHLIPSLGGYKLREITPAAIERMYSEKLHDGLSLTTRKRIHTTLRKALARAHGHGQLARNPADAVGPPKAQTNVEESEVRPYSEEELAAILKAAEGNRLYALYVLAPATGLREQELLALRWDDLTLPETGRGSVRVERAVVEVEGGFSVGPTKNKSSRRTVEFPASVVGAMREHRQRLLEERLRAREWKDSTLVFPNAHGGLMNRYRLGYYWRPLRERAGLGRDRKFSQMRHSYATLMLRRGFQLRLIQAKLGHTSINQTASIYAQWTDDLFPEAGDALGDLF